MIFELCSAAVLWMGTLDPKDPRMDEGIYRVVKTINPRTHKEVVEVEEYIELDATGEPMWKRPDMLGRSAALEQCILELLKKHENK